MSAADRVSSWTIVVKEDDSPLLRQIAVHRAFLGLTGTLWQPTRPNKDKDSPWRCPWCGTQMTLSSNYVPNHSYYCWCECGFHDGPIPASEHREELAKRKAT